MLVICGTTIDTRYHSGPNVRGGSSLFHYQGKIPYIGRRNEHVPAVLSEVSSYIIQRVPTPLFILPHLLDSIF